MAGTSEIFVFKDALIVLGTAAVVAPVVHRLKISPILGFLVVGAALGPHGLGRLAEHSRAIDWLTVTGERQIGFIADLGIVFLLFFIGLELSMRRLLTMRRLVFGLGGLQVIVAALAIGLGALWLGQPPAAALIIGTCLALSSTAIVMELLSGQRRMMSTTGRTSFAILLAQDLAVVPLLFLKMFPEWFAGFCLAAVAIGALVPAAIMSIAASNLFTRNLYGAVLRRKMLPEEESRMAKVVSLVVKFGALLFVLKLPVTYAIEMQLLGGIWMGQLFPSVVVGVFTRWFHPWALFAGWVAGMTSGTAMAVALGLKSSVYPLHLPSLLGGGTYAMYAAVPALMLNLVVSVLLTLVFRAAKVDGGSDVTDAAAYVG